MAIVFIVLIIWSVFALWQFFTSTDPPGCVDRMIRWTSVGIVVIAIVALFLDFEHRFALDWVSILFLVVVIEWVLLSLIVIFFRPLHPHCSDHCHVLRPPETSVGRLNIS